jgi:hypothetical protein
MIVNITVIDAEGGVLYANQLPSRNELFGVVAFVLDIYTC